MKREHHDHTHSEPVMPDQHTTEAGMGRREFLSRLGAGASAAVLMMAGGLPLGQLMAMDETLTKTDSIEGYLASEEPFFARFADSLLLDNRSKYLAIGQKGSQPLPILERYKEGLEQIARDPFPVYLEPSAETRGKIAKGYGARVDEIAISRNTTDAVSMILNGIYWKKGDEILCSTMEYPTCVAAILHLAGRFELKIRQFGVPMARSTEAEEVAESVRKSINPGKTKVIFFSCPTNPNGTRLPAKRIAGIAQKYGIITVVDGAHYGGMFEPNLDETGIDFWGISGHKWQCGPGGTGILYVRNAPHPANPSPLPRFHLVRSGDLDAPTDGSRPEGFDIGAALSVYGFPESADWRALGDVCELWDAMGRQRIQKYILTLSDYARDKITDAFGENALLQPVEDPELKSGIIAFNPFPEPEQRKSGEIGEKFQKMIFEHYGYRVGMGGLGPKGLTRLPDEEARFFPPHCIPNRDPRTGKPAPSEIPFRINACPWSRREDYDQFIDACKDLLKKMI